MAKAWHAALLRPHAIDRRSVPRSRLPDARGRDSDRLTARQTACGGGGGGGGRSRSAAQRVRGMFCYFPVSCVCHRVVSSRVHVAIVYRLRAVSLIVCAGAI